MDNFLLGLLLILGVGTIAVIFIQSCPTCRSFNRRGVKHCRSCGYSMTY